MPENSISGEPPPPPPPPSPPMNTPTYAPKHPPQNHASSPISLILTVILIALFFVTFFSMYFCKCFVEILRQAWHPQRTPSGNLVRSSSSMLPNPGLDPKITQSFPSFPYSSVRNHRTEENYSLECAICLSEFVEDDVLRLLTTCYHVFHQVCVDLWLESHKTCPVCRHDLESSQNGAEIDDVCLPDEIIINIIRENGDGETAGNQRRFEVAGANLRIDQSPERPPEKFSRSHSTGHSIVRVRPEEEDRYTSGLPDHVKIRITRGHNQTESCVTFGEVTRTRHIINGGFGEVSGHNH